MSYEQVSSSPSLRAEMETVVMNLRVVRQCGLPWEGFIEDLSTTGHPTPKQCASHR